MVDDPDNAGVDRGFDRIEGKARFLATDEKHFLADAGADGIDGDERASGWLALGREGLDDEQLNPGQVLVFSRDDDVADDFCDLHGSGFLVPGSGFRTR